MPMNRVGSAPRSDSERLIIMMSTGDESMKKLVLDLSEALHELGLRRKEALTVWPHIPSLSSALLVLRTREDGRHELQAASLSGERWTISLPLRLLEGGGLAIYQRSSPEAPNISEELLLELIMYAHGILRQNGGLVASGP